MAKSEKKAGKGEQLVLIDVVPKKARPIIKAARIYKEYQTARISALAKEKAQKQKVLQMVEDAGIQTLDNGFINFVCDGVTISVEPRDALIKVKEE